MEKTIMRSLCVLFVTLLFAVPVSAVVINCVNEGGGVVRIDYDASSEKMLPIAFALDVAVDGGATITNVYDYKVGDSNAANPGFGIFPNSMQLDPNGDVTDWGNPVVSGGAGTSTVTLGMASRYYDKKNAPRVKGTLCRILVDTHSASMVNVKVTANANGGGIVLEDATVAKLTSSGAVLGVRADKCTVIAGSSPTTDSISVSGSIDVTADKFTIPGSVVVTISSVDIVTPCVQTFPIDSTTFKAGKYKCTLNPKPLKTSFAFDTATSKFSFSAKNVSLKGLSCPVHIEIKIGSYTGAADIDETIVNGTNKPIPIKLLMGVEDSLRVDKIGVKRSTKPSNDQLTARGGFSVTDTAVNMVSVPLAITLDSQTFTIPAGSFKAGTNKFTCSNIVLSDGSVATASFNLRTSNFSLKIKNTSVTAGAGNVGLRLTFAGFNEVELVNI
jgi:hypothetical protein